MLPLWGEGRVHPEQVSSSSQGGRGHHARCQQLHIRSNFGVQYHAQGYFNMQLSSAPGEPGFESVTFRSLATCSTTELQLSTLFMLQDV